MLSIISKPDGPLELYSKSSRTPGKIRSREFLVLLSAQKNKNVEYRKPELSAIKALQQDKHNVPTGRVFGSGHPFTNMLSLTGQDQITFRPKKLLSYTPFPS